MNFKVFLACFVGLIAVNVSHQSPTVKEDDLIPAIVQVLNRVLNTTANLLIEANARVDWAEQNQEGITDRIVAYAVTVGKQINQLILQGIDELRDGATDDGKAVIDCIDAEQEKVEAVITKVFGDIGTCAAGEGPKVITQIRSILARLLDLQSDIQSQTNTLSSCTDEDLVCLISFATTIVETAQKIPSIVSWDISDIIALIRIIVGEVSGCAGEVGTEIKGDVQDIFNEAVVCIKK